MCCHICNSWFYLSDKCPYLKVHTNFVDQEEMSHTQPASVPTSQTTNDNLAYPVYQIENLIQEYDNQDTPVIDGNTVTFAPNTSHDTNQTMYFTLLDNCTTEMHCSNNEYLYLNQPRVSPSSLVHLLELQYNIQSPLTFDGFCLDEGAPLSVTGLRQWFAYIETYNLPTTLQSVVNNKNSLTFGGKGKGKVQYRSLGVVIIRVPLQNYEFFDYQSLLISNYVPILVGLKTQSYLRALTDKDPNNLTIHLRALNVVLPRHTSRG